MTSIKSKIAVLTALLCLTMTLLQGQNASFTLVSWNIQDFGKTKDHEEIKFIAKAVKDFDIVAIQEVVAGDGGAQAVARLADQLNRMGSKWDYRVSDPTKSPPYKTERYAFLWKTSKVKLVGRPWLENSLVGKVNRPPYLARFNINGKEVIILNFHSRRYDEKPEEEVVHFSGLVTSYLPTPLIIAGDFNMPESNAAFDALKKQGYAPVLKNQPTTLKKNCATSNGSYLSHAIDNIFYPKEKVRFLEGGVVDFVGDCEWLEERRGVSDHLGVWGRVK
jgi:deoxyribonuclease-1-like protein